MENEVFSPICVPLNPLLAKFLFGAITDARAIDITNNIASIIAFAFALDIAIAIDIPVAIPKIIVLLNDISIVIANVTRHRHH